MLQHLINYVFIVIIIILVVSDGHSVQSTVDLICLCSVASSVNKTCIKTVMLLEIFVQQLRTGQIPTIFSQVYMLGKHSTT